jgi:hypothetical protein
MYHVKIPTRSSKLLFINGNMLPSPKKYLPSAMRFISIYAILTNACIDIFQSRKNLISNFWFSKSSNQGNKDAEKERKGTKNCKWSDPFLISYFFFTTTVEREKRTNTKKKTPTAKTSWQDGNNQIKLKQKIPKQKLSLSTQKNSLALIQRKITFLWGVLLCFVYM